MLRERRRRCRRAAARGRPARTPITGTCAGGAPRRRAAPADGRRHRTPAARDAAPRRPAGGIARPPAATGEVDRRAPARTSTSAPWRAAPDLVGQHAERRMSADSASALDVASVSGSPRRRARVQDLRSIDHRLSVIITASVGRHPLGDLLRPAPAPAGRRSPPTSGARPPAHRVDEVLQFARSGSSSGTSMRAAFDARAAGRRPHEPLHLDFLRAVVDRHVRVALEEPDLPHAVAADAAGREVGDAAGREPQPRVRDVDPAVSTGTPTASMRRDLASRPSTARGRGRGSSGRTRRRCRGCARGTCPSRCTSMNRGLFTARPRGHRRPG